MQLTFYGGADTVGGTQILVQPPEGKSVLLDFGHSFAVDDLLLDPFLQPRNSRALIDRIAVGLLPVPDGPLAHLHRIDLAQYYASELEARYALPQTTRRPFPMSHVCS